MSVSIDKNGAVWATKGKKLVEAVGIEKLRNSL